MKYNVGDDTYSVDVRMEVAEFAEAMEQKLRKNDHKTGWKDQPIEAHIQLLAIEKMELDVALEFLGDEAAMKECVDVANFAMIIRDKLRVRIADREKFKGVSLASLPEYDPHSPSGIEQQAVAVTPPSLPPYYKCGVCGTHDRQFWRRCQHPSCHDGRDSELRR